MRWVTAAVLMLLLGPELRADLDIAVPAGSALDWDRELHQPTPSFLTTPYRSTSGTSNHATVLSTKPAPTSFEYTTVNLIGFLRIKTIDIATHLNLRIPERYPSSVKIPVDNAVGTGGSFARLESGIEGKYPPKVPGELVWVSIANCLRTVLHPELVSEPELLSYLIELGEPSLVGATTVDSSLGAKLKPLISDLPAVAPELPVSSNPRDAMLAKVAMLELISGYPYSLDPSYARRTLMTGDLAYEAVLKCAESSHPFLARNAVAVLANFYGERAAKDLERVFAKSHDPVIRVRCLAGMARKKDKAHLPTLLNAATAREEWLRAMAIYALGYVGEGNREAARLLVSQLANASVEQLWTLLPALARIGDRSPETQKALRDVATRLWSEAKGIPHPIPPGERPTDFRAPNPEPAGYRKRIVADYALIALAACGDAPGQQELMAKLERGGIRAFTEASWMLLADLVGSMGDRGVEEAKKLVLGSEGMVAFAAIRGMARVKNPDVNWLKNLVLTGSPIQAAAGLMVLFQCTVGEVREACHEIVKRGATGGAESAYLVGLAIQILDKADDNNGAELLRVIESNPNATARREASDEYDVTKCRIDVFPPLLEIAVLAIGRTSHEPAIAKLIDLLKSGPAQVRACAALALSGAEPLRVRHALLEALIDPKDGWVRFCAYLSLKNLTGKDYFTDYCFGSAAGIFDAYEKYRKEFAGK